MLQPTRVRSFHDEAVSVVRDLALFSVLDLSDRGGEHITIKI